MRLPNDHLSAAEIELLRKGEGLSGKLGDELRLAREHAKSCPACRRRLEVYPTARPELERLRAPHGAQKGQDCPSIEVWLQLAGGLLNNAQQERYAAHAAQCDYCGPVLREIVDDFSRPLTEQESAALAELKVRDEDELRRNQDPSRVPRTARRSQHRSPFRPWQIAAAGLLVGCGITFALFRLPFFKKADGVAMVEQKLAQAYTEKRTIELRIFGAAYGPMRVERGAPSSHLNQPAALLEAEAVLARDGPIHPRDPGWLQASARARLLEWDYEGALASLNEALAIKETSSLLLDKATALFEQAQATNDPSYYERTIQLLEEVLQKEPENPLALFNEAVACEHAFLYDKAQADWERFLRLSSADGWADEARRRLGELQKKLSEYERKIGEQLLGPGALAQKLSGGNQGDLEAIDSRVEEYLDVAIGSWLPQAFPEQAAAREGEEAQAADAALQQLAMLLRERHSDGWLGDMMSEKQTPPWPRALSALAAAIRQNIAGDPGAAQKQADAAARLFLRADSEAGYLRARLEEVYALHRAAQGKACLKAGNGLLHDLDHKDYQWIRIQLGLEKAVCESLLSDWATAISDLNDAIARSDRTGYPTLHLRAIGLQAGLQRSSGDVQASWLTASRGLGTYWSGTYPPMRGYQFYQDLSFASDKMAHLHVSLLLAQEALQRTIEAHEPVSQVLARYRVVRAEIEDNHPEEARHQYGIASQASATIPQMQSTKLYGISTAVQLANADLDQNQVEEARQLLQSADPDLASFSSDPLMERYYQAEGKLFGKLGKTVEEEQALHSAIAIAERRLTHLKTLHDLVAWENDARDAYKGIVRLELLTDPAESLEIWEAYRGAAVRSRTAGSGDQSSGAESRPSTFVRSKLPLLQNETILSYAAFADGVGMWVYDDRGISSRFVPIPSARLTNLIAHFVNQCRDPRSNLATLKETSSQLYQLLIAPVESQLSTGRTLVFELDDDFNQLPIQALLDGNGEYLGVHFRVVFSPGLFYYDHLRGREEITRDTPALIASYAGGFESSSGDTVAPLADADAESSAIALNFSKPVVLRNGQAEFSSLARLLPRAVVFHFAGHTLVESGQARLALVGSPRHGTEFIDADHFESVPLGRLQLAVLSGCSTAGAPGDILADFHSFAQVFLLQGVRNIVLTDWAVDSSATVAYMESFYGGLMRGSSVPAALQEAAAHIASKPETSHPYYWAAFLDFGHS